MASSQKNEQGRFFKLASAKSVKTACVCGVFFFYYFKYYGHFQKKNSVLFNS